METENSGYINALKIYEEPLVNVKEKMFTILFALIIGIIFDYFFNGKALGISFPIFNILLLCLFMYSARGRIIYKKPMGWFLLGLILLLSLRAALYSNMIITFFNVLFVPVFIAAYTIIVTDEKVDWSKFIFIIEMLDRIIVRAFSNMLKPFKILHDAAKLNTKNRSSTGRDIIIGLLISIFLLIIIIPLLASADMAFGFYLNNIFSIFSIDSFPNIMGHTILIIFIFLYVFGYAWSFKYSQKEKLNISLDIKEKVEPRIIVTILIVVDFLYLFFSILQISYLYGGSSGVLPQGFTYAEYARRGFFELVAVTAINFIILLFSMKLVRKDNLKIKRVVNIALSFLVLFTLNMLISAHIRMSLYEDSFGFTQLRLYVHIFMFLMFILFIISFAKIWSEKIPLFKVSFISAMVIYIIMNYMNLDGIIASNNIERYGRTGKIDIAYLCVLSNDALPQIVEFTKSADTDISWEIQNNLNERYVSLGHGFQWMEYNYSRNMAKIILDTNTSSH